VKDKGSGEEDRQGCHLCILRERLTERLTVASAWDISINEGPIKIGLPGDISAIFLYSVMVEQENQLTMCFSARDPMVMYTWLYD
jgi:hypothetical protein